MVEIKTSLSGNAIEGLDKLDTRVKQIVLLSGVAAMARVYYDQLKINTSGIPGGPGVVTGTLHDAVYRAYSPEKSTNIRKVYNAGVNHIKAPHWHLIEYGSSRNGARPYMRPALDKSLEAIRAGNKRMSERLKEL